MDAMSAEPHDRHDIFVKGIADHGQRVRRAAIRGEHACVSRSVLAVDNLHHVKLVEMRKAGQFQRLADEIALGKYPERVTLLLQPHQGAFKSGRTAQRQPGGALWN